MRGRGRGPGQVGRASAWPDGGQRGGSGLRRQGARGRTVVRRFGAACGQAGARWGPGWTRCAIRQRPGRPGRGVGRPRHGPWCPGGGPLAQRPGRCTWGWGNAGERPPHQRPQRGPGAEPCVARAAEWLRFRAAATGGPPQGEAALAPGDGVGGGYRGRGYDGGGRGGGGNEAGLPSTCCLLQWLTDA
jgi:hypothetical protein